MCAPVIAIITLLCQVVVGVPIGTNLGLVHVLWMMVSGRLLVSRGAIIPGLHEAGLERRAIGRAWHALGQGQWQISGLLDNWQDAVAHGGRWQVRAHGGYTALPADLVGFWRPQLKNCPTKHFDHRANRALPAIVLGVIGRSGQVGPQRLALPLAIVRADSSDPSERRLMQQMLHTAQRLMGEHDVLTLDGGFTVEDVQQAKVERYVLKVAKNSTFRRNQPRPYKGRGRHPVHGELVRPLARQYKDHTVPATPPDRTVTWHEDGVLLRADIWDDLVPKDAGPHAPGFTVLACHDPRFAQPLLVLTSLSTLEPRHVRSLYLDRWPIEQLPLAAKQMIGAARAFVFAPETVQRLPEVALLAGAILSYVAASQPAIPTGYWDRQPQPTPGRLRRYLARCPFPTDFPWPAEIRSKASFTDHLPKGIFACRRSKALVAAV